MRKKQDTQWISRDKWETIVQHMPIVSVDLIVRVGDGVLLGKRENEPAKGEWFVPGGRVYKGELRREAVHRVAQEELDMAVKIDRCLGTYEHFYDTAEVVSADGKHYLATGFVVTPKDDNFIKDEQHSELQIFNPPFSDLHPYVEQYLDEVKF